jgi:midasin (ATPase involved in ribosome maturation)
LIKRCGPAGDWILVDNVNFCNPTVLDRLNPLLENNGVLMVNERGLVNGEVKVITPHPNFRIFLAMDPHNGEISRAMRNRGIEISLLPLDAASFDTLALLNGIGVPGAWLARLMTGSCPQSFF